MRQAHASCFRWQSHRTAYEWEEFNVEVERHRKLSRHHGASSFFTFARLRLLFYYHIRRHSLHRRSRKKKSLAQCYLRLCLDSKRPVVGISMPTLPDRTQVMREEALHPVLSLVFHHATRNIPRSPCEHLALSAPQILAIALPSDDAF